MSNGPVSLVPKNIKIIGWLDEGAPLVGDKTESRMFTRFAERSMMYSFVNYLPRQQSDDSTDTVKKQLFLGAEFAFEGIGSSFFAF